MMELKERLGVEDLKPIAKEIGIHWKTMDKFEKEFNKSDGVVDESIYQKLLEAGYLGCLESDNDDEIIEDELDKVTAKDEEIVGCDENLELEESNLEADNQDGTFSPEVISITDRMRNQKLPKVVISSVSMQTRSYDIELDCEYEPMIVLATDLPDNINFINDPITHESQNGNCIVRMHVLSHRFDGSIRISEGDCLFTLVPARYIKFDID